MAQLPLEGPTMTLQDPDWQDFQPLPLLPVMSTESPSTSASVAAPAPLMALPPIGVLVSSDHQTQSSSPPWVDEFVEFSAARRKVHRRSISDLIDFVEDQMPYEFHPGPPDHHQPMTSGGGSGAKSGDEFDRFDDNQLMSMFNNELVNEIAGPASSSSNPTFSSVRESMHYEGKTALAAPSNGVEQRGEEMVVKRENEEGVESSSSKNDNKSQQSQGVAGGGVASGSIARVIDPKRVKRILANRQSAQRSRIRKLQYISELERSITTLQNEVSTLAPRVAFLDHQRMNLSVDNSTVKARIAVLAQDKIFKDAHQEALKKEIERLKQVYCQKSLKVAENPTVDTSFPQPSTMAIQASLCDIRVQEQLIN